MHRTPRLLEPAGVTMAAHAVEFEDIATCILLLIPSEAYQRPRPKRWDRPDLGHTFLTPPPLHKHRRSPPRHPRSAAFTWTRFKQRRYFPRGGATSALRTKARESSPAVSGSRRGINTYLRAARPLRWSSAPATRGMVEAEQPTLAVGRHASGQRGLGQASQREPASIIHSLPASPLSGLAP